MEVLQMPKEDFRKDSTNKLIEIIDSAKAQMPKEATHMKIIRKSKRGINSLGVGYDYYRTYCVYYNDNENFYEPISKYFDPMFLGYEKVGSVEICGDIMFQKEYAINYILYTEGLYRPNNLENLKSIKAHYWGLIDAKIIYPINDLCSDEYMFRSICENIIENHKDSKVKLSFIMDYEYCENRWEKYLKGKKEYAVKGRITCDEINFVTDYDWDTGVWILFDKTITELTKNGVDKENILIEYDMEEEDKEKMLSHLRWGGCGFD